MRHNMMVLCLVLPALVQSALMIGTGIYDATGPISDVVMMGMANPSQINEGLHQRLRSRAFVAYDQESGKRFAFVSLDSGMVGDILKKHVVEELNKRLPSSNYSYDNVALSGTHTHSGPSGFLQEIMLQFSGTGWVPQTLNSYVTGVVESIVMADKNLVPATGYISRGALHDANINRSPSSYLRNPEKERAQYDYDTDQNMTLLKLVAEDGKELGMFNWFAVHPTSMNNTNILVSGDNKGYASYLTEQWKNGPTSSGTLPGLGSFVAAFGSTNLGDVSPNTNGPHCQDTGLPCDVLHSTCDGRTELCVASGPGKDMFESCEIIGRKQFEFAKELYNKPGAKLHSKNTMVDYVSSYVMMPGLNVSDPVTGEPVGSLCKAAMGDSFAAGTTDGPGMFDFTQGANSSNPFWHFIVGFIHKVTPEEKACQEPKGVLLPTGSLDKPWPWAPKDLPMQILRLGQLVILVVPTEMTTMAGRRLRTHLKTKMVQLGLIGDDGVVVIAGLSNGYADYTVTYEEYQAQRYEAASTIYGPHQLNAYIQEFSRLAEGMAAGHIDPGTLPEDFSGHLIDTGPKIKTDHLPEGAKYYGQVLNDTHSSYVAGDVAIATFAGGNPLNDLKPQGTFAEVQQCMDDACSKYNTVAVDGDWDTRIHIHKFTTELIEHSRTWDISWYIPSTVTPGKYRIVHSATSYKNPIIGKHVYTKYSGNSSVFTVTKSVA